MPIPRAIHTPSALAPPVPFIPPPPSTTSSAIQHPLTPSLLTIHISPFHRYGFDSLLVRWSAPLTPSSRGLSSRLGVSTLSGQSRYYIGTDGRFSRHALQRLQINGRPLPSSTLGALLAEYRRGGARAAEGDMMGLVRQLFVVAPGGPSGGRGSSGKEYTLSADEKTTRTGGSDTPCPPPPGSAEWPNYESFHLATRQLAAELFSLLDTAAPPPNPSRYAPGLTLRASNAADPLLIGREAYLQLLGSARTAHAAVSISPLLEHSFDFQLQYRGGAGRRVRASGGAGEGGSAADGAAIVADPFWTETAAIAPPSGTATPLPSGTPATPTAQPSPAGAPNTAGGAGVEARWRYALAPNRGPAAGTPVFTLSATSQFCFSGPAAAGAAGGMDASTAISVHTLRDLRVNGRPALPDQILSRLGGAGGSAGALLPLLGSAFVSVSETALRPLQPAAAAAAARGGGAGRAGAGGNTSGGSRSPLSVGAGAVPVSPAFAFGFASLVRALNEQMPKVGQCGGGVGGHMYPPSGLTPPFRH